MSPAKKNGPQLSRCQSATRTVRLGNVAGRQLHVGGGEQDWEVWSMNRAMRLDASYPLWGGHEPLVNKAAPVDWSGGLRNVTPAQTGKAATLQNPQSFPETAAAPF